MSEDKYTTIKHYSKNNKCIICNNLITDYAKKCRKCAYIGFHNSLVTEFKKGHEVDKELKNKLSLLYKNRKKNLTLEQKKKLSERLKNNKYRFGLNPWNKGLTKENNKSLQLISIKKSLYNHHNWHGGISFEPYGIEFNNRIKNIIRKRDNQICMNCGVHREKLNEALHIHHINYDKGCNIEQNLISLCIKCHMFTNYNRNYWTKLFQEKLNKLYEYKYKDGDILLEVKDSKNA